MVKSAPALGNLAAGTLEDSCFQLTMGVTTPDCFPDPSACGRPWLCRTHPSLPPSLPHRTRNKVVSPPQQTCVFPSTDVSLGHSKPFQILFLIVWDLEAMRFSNILRLHIIGLFLFSAISIWQMPSWTPLSYPLLKHNINPITPAP